MFLFWYFPRPWRNLSEWYSRRKRVVQYRLLAEHAENVQLNPSSGETFVHECREVFR